MELYDCAVYQINKKVNQEFLLAAAGRPSVSLEVVVDGGGG